MTNKDVLKHYIDSDGNHHLYGCALYFDVPLFNGNILVYNNCKYGVDSFICRTERENVFGKFNKSDSESHIFSAESSHLITKLELVSCCKSINNDKHKLMIDVQILDSDTGKEVIKAINNGTEILSMMLCRRERLNGEECSLEAIHTFNLYTYEEFCKD